MNFKNRFYPESQFGGFTNIDGTVIFYSRINSLIDKDDIVVDIGCGRGAYGDDSIRYRRNLRILKDKCKKVIGLDIDPRAASNPFINEFYLIGNETWPLESESVNLCLCDYVLEHLSNPDAFFQECYRILKPGGYLCIRTSNQLSYFGLITKILPERMHSPVLSISKDHLSEIDKFKVNFRCNSVSKIKGMLKKYHFHHVVFGYDAEPGYLGFSIIFYWLGVLHQRYAPGLLKVGIFAFARKL